MTTRVDDAEASAMLQALRIARRGPAGLNPQVGCVVLDVAGQRVGEGWHHGAGTPHAEVEAMRAAGGRARGGTAVVTLEPCRHTGRTGPCTRALVEAGIARVVYGTSDPDPVAGGGAAELAAAGIPADLVADEGLRSRAAELLRPWALAHRFGRPYVLWKFAATLDGRSAAADGTSQWITGEQARADVHGWRGTCDAIVAGTGTVLADDPQLTVRGQEVVAQPLRVVVGLRDLPATARVLDGQAPMLHLRTRDPREVLTALWERGLRRVWMEGGPTLAAAFVRAGLVDEVIAYLAPALLGAGTSAVADLGVAGIDGAVRMDLQEVAQVGNDVRIRAVVSSRL